MRLDLGTTSLALFILGGFSPRTFAAQDPEPQEGPTPIELPGMLDEAQQALDDIEAGAIAGRAIVRF